jgi:Mechanosensitive ion channel, conserved TM helix
MPVAPITSWGEALVTSFAAALAMFMGAIPRIIGFVVILVIGWLVASLLAAVVAKLLRAVRFNDLARRSGLTSFVHNMGVNSDGAGLIADVTKWFVRLIALVVAFDALGLPAVSQVLQQLLLWLPNVVVAVVILVLAGLAANAVGSLIRGATAEAGFSNPDLLSTVARVAIWAFAIVVAVNQLGIATTLVNTLFMGLVAAMALAFGLAFGLGGRDTAGRSGAASQMLARAAAAAQPSDVRDDADMATPRPQPAMPAATSVGRRSTMDTSPQSTPPQADSPAASDGPSWGRSPEPPPDYGRPLRGTQND